MAAPTGSSVLFHAPTAAAPQPEVRARWPVAILGVPFDCVTMSEALGRIDAMMASGRPHYVVTPNVDFLVQARSDAELHRILCNADLVLCDGQPLVWASQFLGNPLPERVAGSDLVPAAIADAARKGRTVFLLGASEEANALARARLRERFPTLRVHGFAPPFRALADEEEAAVAARIRAARPDLVLVAFGCPKQEKWIARNYRTLGAAVCIGVGATIDFLAGRVRRAPRWMGRCGLEWAYRLAQEPGRLFQRYATDLRCFTVALCEQWWRHSALLRPGSGEVHAALSAGTENVRVRGALDRRAIELAGHIWGGIGAGGLDCRLDLGEVTFIDSTGAAVLAVCRRRFERTGKRLDLVRISGEARRLLRGSGVLSPNTVTLRA